VHYGHRATSIHIIPAITVSISMQTKGGRAETGGFADLTDVESGSLVSCRFIAYAPPIKVGPKEMECIH
jgi:hypothetical protein